MLENYVLENGLIDVVSYLDSVIKIENKSFYDVIRKDRNFIKSLDKKYLLNGIDLIKYIRNSTIIHRYCDTHKDTLTDMIVEVYNFELGRNKVKKDEISDLKIFFNFDCFNDIKDDIINDLEKISRDAETDAPLRHSVLELVQKWTLIISYKVKFATTRGRFTTIRNWIRDSKIEDDIKTFFLSRFNFSKLIGFKIHERTDEKVFEKISNKIEINKKEFESNFLKICKSIDDFDIKLDSNNNVISAKNAKIARAANGKLIKVDFLNNQKAKDFTRLAYFVVLATGRRLAELLVRPSNIKKRISLCSKKVKNFDNVADLKYQEIFIKVKKNNDIAIFLNQKKKKENSDIVGFEIPINGGYERVIKALLFLRMFIPNTTLKRGEREVATVMRTYLTKNFLQDNISSGLKDMKDCRSLYAIYNENKYNRGLTDSLVYCQEILGHEHGMQDLKTTLHYDRFKLI